MEITDNSLFDDGRVSYEAAPVAELQIEEIEYRVDAGLGAIVAVSQREAGTSCWAVAAEGRWDGVRLRAKGLEHAVVVALERALALAMREREEGFA